MSKPSIPKGTRDFIPEQVVKRNYIFDTIKKVFVTYGYQPIETPVMENLSTLTGKYGSEGDQLLFKVLNNGDFLAKADQGALNNRDSKGVTSSISKRGLRYDLTVPFARFVVMHQNEISLPFKRYAIQPVWRADRPQKGRYQEFYQCDVDVVGSDSLMYEAELVKIYDEVFSRLGINVTIKINNRKVLEGIAEAAGAGDSFAAMTVAIDKLDKIGVDGVKKEMLQNGISEDSFTHIMSSLAIKSLSDLEQRLSTSETGMVGISELKAFHQYFDPIGHNNTVKLDLTLARGLSYYTGCIIEVAANDVQMGSIGGGGRYDDLTGMFGLRGVSGVGISFGAERIYDVMEELDLFDNASIENVKAIFLSFDDESHLYGFECANQLRSQNIAVDVYPEPAKMKKQMKYADSRGFKYALLIGETERETKLITVKNLKTGDQDKMSIDQVAQLLK